MLNYTWIVKLYDTNYVSTPEAPTAACESMTPQHEHEPQNSWSLSNLFAKYFVRNGFKINRTYSLPLREGGGYILVRKRLSSWRLHSLSSHQVISPHRAGRPGEGKPLPITADHPSCTYSRWHLSRQSPIPFERRAVRKNKNTTRVRPTIIYD